MNILPRLVRSGKKLHVELLHKWAPLRNWIRRKLHSPSPCWSQRVHLDLSPFYLKSAEKEMEPFISRIGPGAHLWIGTTLDFSPTGNGVLIFDGRILSRYFWQKWRLFRKSDEKLQQMLYNHSNQICLKLMDGNRARVREIGGGAPSPVAPLLETFPFGNSWIDSGLQKLDMDAWIQRRALFEQSHISTESMLPFAAASRLLKRYLVTEMYTTSDSLELLLPRPFVAAGNDRRFLLTLHRFSELRESSNLDQRDAPVAESVMELSVRCRLQGDDFCYDGWLPLFRISSPSENQKDIRSLFPGEKRTFLNYSFHNQCLTFSCGSSPQSLYFRSRAEPIRSVKREDLLPDIVIKESYHFILDKKRGDILLLRRQPITPVNLIHIMKGPDYDLLHTSSEDATYGRMEGTPLRGPAAFFSRLFGLRIESPPHSYFCASISVSYTGSRRIRPHECMVGGTARANLTV